MKSAPTRIRILSIPVLAATVTGCIVVPNFVPIKKPLTIRKVEVGKSNREDVHRILGKPQVVETEDFYVYAWERSSAFLLGYSSDEPVGLRATRAIVGFDSEGNVVRLETSWDETEPDLPVLLCEQEIPGCSVKRNRPGIGVTALEFTPDGESLSAATWVAKWGSCILDPSDGRVLARFDFTTPYSYGNRTPPAHAFAAMSFSGDGRLLAAVNGSSLWVWEALDGTERMRVCPTGSKSCRVRGGSLALSPDGTRVAYRQRGKGLVIRSLEDGEVLSEADATDPVFSPDGSLIAARIGNGGITILESEGGTVLASRPAESKSKWRLRALAFSPDGRHLAVASCAHAELHRLEGILESGRFGRPEAAVLLPMPRTSGLSCWPQALFSRDGSQMAVLTADALTRLEVPTGALLSKVRFRHAPTVVALGPGLKRLALATGEKLRICALGEE